MAVERTSCLYRGNTFFGTMQTVETSTSKLVCVEYNGHKRRSMTNGFPVEAVAEALLQELVAMEAVLGERPEWRAVLESRV